MDTASILIADPAYVYDDKIYPKDYENFLNELLFPMLEEEREEVKFPLGQAGAGVILNFGGDGELDVYKRVDEHGNTTSVLIE